MIEGTKPAHTSSQLFDAVRGIGIERGADLILRVLVVRWMTLAMPRPDRSDWRELAEANPQGKVDLLRRFPLSDPDDEIANSSESYRDALSKVVASVDRMDVGEGEGGLWSPVAETYDAVLDLLEEIGPEAGGSQTPKLVADLLAELTVRPGDTVHDPACGVGNLLMAAHAAAPDVRLSGNEANSRTAQRAQMRLYLHQIVELITADNAFEVTEPESADTVLLQPPWGAHSESERRWMSSETPIAGATTRTGDIPWLFLALRTLRSAGRAAVILTHNSFFPSHRRSHAELLGRDAVEAIISLPGGLFRHTGIATAIWLLRTSASATCRGKVLFIDAESMVEVAGRKHLELSREAVARLSGLIGQYRENGTVDAPGFLARVVETASIDLARGLLPQVHLDEPPPETTTHPLPDRTLLTRILLHNFKAFGPKAQIDLAPLTLVYGANSAGKSSIIQALLLLKQSMAYEGMITQGPLVDVGGFAGVVHRHTADGVGLGFTYGALPSWLPPGGTPDPSLLRTVQWYFGAGDAVAGALRVCRFRFGPHELNFRAESDLLHADLSSATDLFRGLAVGDLLYPFEVEPRRGNGPRRNASRLSQEQNSKRALRVLRSGTSDRLPLRRLGLMPSAEAALTRSLTASSGSRDQSFAATYAGRVARLASGISAEVRQLLDSLVWLGPLRSAPRRVYDRSSTDPNPGDGRQTAMFLFDHVSVVDQVNDWMEQLEVPYSLEVLPLNAGSTSGLVGDLVAIVLTDRRSGVQVTPADVGFGISQVLPIVVELLSRRESIIMIEQPETHLHPRLQSRLADLFIETARVGGRGNQVIVETHSEHVMLRIQRRIREGTLDAGDVQVVYIDQDSEGSAVVHRLRVDTDGNFVDEWPHGFFEERLGELFGEF
ncbi:DUF3696 domain-containing protein [Micromonospora noduli]|uniref:DUF3696 domain-containing protein n=1 Tax=Micromonospora noduli TaxID=709876 RepID=UPI00124B9AE2|nr:DUF3696 domain-containing protein [Micromonospora noduli]KAB1925785.1 DUF3696 domain-containing protein [Micromonospora noduli]